MSLSEIFIPLEAGIDLLEQHLEDESIEVGSKLALQVYEVLAGVYGSYRGEVLPETPILEALSNFGDTGEITHLNILRDHFQELRDFVLELASSLEDVA